MFASGGTGFVGHIYAFNTYQFTDYGKYVSDYFSEKEKAAYREQHWDIDRKAAYDLGTKIAGRDNGEK